jgi:hypothetical protein
VRCRLEQPAGYVQPGERSEDWAWRASSSRILRAVGASASIRDEGVRAQSGAAD